MLRIAAVILTDPSRTPFAGVELNERAALVADRAGIIDIHFVGGGIPDAGTLDALGDRGLRITTSTETARPLANAPEAQITVVLPARTVLQPSALMSFLQEFAADPTAPALVVMPERYGRNHTLQLTDGIAETVIGGGNASSTGVAILPFDAAERVRSVWDFGDAVHRLAKTGTLRGLAVGSRFCVRVEKKSDVARAERDYARLTESEEGLMAAGMRVMSEAMTRQMLRLPATVNTLTFAGFRVLMGA